MSELEDQKAEALLISNELVRALVGLGIDWRDEISMRVLAREALDYHPGAHLAPDDVAGHTRVKLFGLIGLMLRTMEEGADLGKNVHGSDAWKALAKALWAEKEASGK